ncbi:MAG: hypothetical protein IJ449_01050 [Clostridia bacterium]|nr:hypothetical protein [Clostridia bacterium]
MNEYFAWFGLPGTFVLTMLMSLLSLVLAVCKKKKAAWICFAAMATSSVGDLFMTRFGNLEEIFGGNCFVLGAAFFMVAHILYLTSYRMYAKAKSYKFFNGGVVAALVIALACLVYFTVVCAQRNDFSMYFLCMLYLIVITCNCATIFSYAWASVTEGKKPYMALAGIGALSFLLSDMIIGLDALAGISDFGWLIWWLYPVGQILINIFAI